MFSVFELACGFLCNCVAKIMVNMIVIILILLVADETAGKASELVLQRTNNISPNGYSYQTMGNSHS
jgi:hypothetical protein